MEMRWAWHAVRKLEMTNKLTKKWKGSDHMGNIEIDEKII
jgi:hypothetical protein